MDRSTQTREPVRLVIIAALVLLVSIVPTASGYHRGTTKIVETSVSESVTLPVNNWTAYTFTLGVTEVIEYNVLVTNGTAIDVYFVPEEQLVNYANDSASSFQYFREGTNDTLSAVGTFNGASGVVSVIIDNVDIVPGDAEPTGPVTVSVNLTKSSNLFLGGLIFIGCGIALLAVALIVFLILRRRKAAAPPPPPAPYAGPPSADYPPGGPPPAAPEGPPQGPSPPPSPPAL